jgi:HK97 family phage major capsid protein
MEGSAQELRQERAQVCEQLRTLNDTVEARGDGYTGEEDANYKKLFAKQEELKSEIEKIETRKQADDQRKSDLAALTGEMAKVNPPSERLGPNGGQKAALDPNESRSARARKSDEYRDQWRHWLLTGAGQPELEERSFQADLGTQAGYLVMPMETANQLIKFIDDNTYIRQLATKFTVERAVSLGAPQLTTDPADSDWTTELATGSEDTAMDVGLRELIPHPCAKQFNISNKLLRMAAMNVEQFVLQRLAYKLAITHEKAFLLGSGAQQPLGVFTASSNGIPTSRDVSTGNSTTEPQFDGLIACKYAIKDQYRPRLRWLFHRNCLELIAKKKDGNGNYIWRESVRAGEPDSVLGIPVLSSEYVPNTFTTGLYVGILGDFSNYWIADALDFQVQRLVELNAKKNQTLFIIRAESDGAPVLAEAFARVKLA